MKKYYIIFAAALLVAVSCTQNEIAPAEAAEEPAVEITDDSEPRGLTFTATWEKPATVNAAAGTKTTLGDNGLDVLWKANDAINLFDGDGDAYELDGFSTDFVKGTRYQAYNISGDKLTATFKVSSTYAEAAEGKSVYWAFTPYIGDAAFDFTNTKLIAWLVRYQRGNAGNFSEQRGTEGRYLNFAAGSTTDPENEPIVFKNILCHLKFTVPASMEGKITRIGVHTGSGEYLSGDQIVDFSGAAPATSLRYDYGGYNKGSRYSTMYLFPDHGTGNNANITGGQTFAAGSYYMAIMPCTLNNGLYVTFETEDGDVCHIDHYAVATTFERNKVYDMGELTFSKGAVDAPGTGVTLPYAMSFLEATSSNNNLVYSNAGSLVEGSTVVTSAGNWVPSSGTIATDKSNTNVTLSAMVSKGTPKNTSQQSLGFWANPLANDAINIGSVLNRFAVAGIPFENYVRFNIPLEQDMPSVFNIAVGLGNSNATYSIADWKVLYSNDTKVWIECPEDVHFGNYVAYPFHLLTVKHGELFKAGKMLYVKVVGVSNTCTSGNTGDGQGGSGAIRVHSAFMIFNPDIPASATPAGAQYYEGFDDVKGGVDYFLGGGDRLRLAGMANFCGEAFSASGWTASNVYSRPGYVQIGYLETQTNNTTVKNPAIGVLTTPAIGVSGDVELSFKAAAYRHPAAGRTGATTNDVATPDETSITVTVLNGGTIDGDTTVQIDDVDTEAWQTITKTIVGATAATQIQFSSPATGTYHRWFLDDITVK